MIQEVNQPRIRIAGLRRSDIHDFRSFLSNSGNKAFHFTEEELTPGRLGEPATIIVVGALTATAISVFGAWLLKRRTETEIVCTAVIEHSNGSKQSTTLRISQQSSEAPSEQVIQQLATMSKLPAEEIKELLK